MKLSCLKISVKSEFGEGLQVDDEGEEDLGEDTLFKLNVLDLFKLYDLSLFKCL